MGKRIVRIVAFSLASASCSSPQQHQLNAQAIGAPPRNYEAITSFFEHSLLDPSTARYEFGQPYKAYEDAPLIHGGGTEWQGWAVDVNVMAKNAYGAYAGWQGYFCEFTGDAVKVCWENWRRGNAGADMFHRL